MSKMALCAAHFRTQQGIRNRSASLGRQQIVHTSNERFQFVKNNSCDHIPIGSFVIMDQPMPESSNLNPRSLRMTFNEFPREAVCLLPDIVQRRGHQPLRLNITNKRISRYRPGFDNL